MDQQVTRYEIFGLIAGIILGAAPVLGAWYWWGQYHPVQSLVWGAPLKNAAFPAGFIGAVLGVLAGNAARHFRIK